MISAYVYYRALETLPLTITDTVELHSKHSMIHLAFKEKAALSRLPVNTIFSDSDINCIPSVCSVR